MKLSYVIGLPLFCGVLLAFAGSGCASDAACDLNETRACVCPTGQSGAQACDANGDWTPCSCAGDGGGGGGGGNGGGGGGNGATFKHGTVCLAPTYACGTATNLLCTVDQQGDAQGVCRLSCSTFADCLDNDDARSRFDTECCEVGNGTRVCGNQNEWPAGACD